jgi:hypothetical protein
VKNYLIKDESLKWIFYYFVSSGKRLSEKKGGRNMKTFENIMVKSAWSNREMPN